MIELVMPAGGWSGNVGVRGGIPQNYTMFCNVKVAIPGYSGPLAVGDGVTDDSTVINTALALCPNGQYVYIPEGTYRLMNRIYRKGLTYYDNVQRPMSVAIRGAGADKTKLLYYGAGTAIFFETANSYGARRIKITSGNTRGSTQITLENMDEYLATNCYGVVIRSNIEAVKETLPGYMGSATSQIVKIMAVDAASKTVTVSPALNEGYPSDEFHLSISAPFRCGLEDFYIENKTNSGGHNIMIEGGQECWIKGVESVMASKWHIRMQTSANCEIRECIVHDGWDGGGDSIYGYGLFQFCCNNLIENNIAYRVRHALILEDGGQNNVFGYNYSFNPINGDKGQNPLGIIGGGPGQLATDYLMGDMITHGGQPRYNLWEGNVAATIKEDNVLGGATFNTFFRNNVQRKGLPAIYVATYGSDIQTLSYNTQLIGNVYDNLLTQFFPLRRWGSSGDDQSNPDPLSASTTILHGEVDESTGIVTWSSLDHSLDNSLYLTAKPAWWDNGIWPAIGPDLSVTKSENPAFRRYGGEVIEVPIDPDPTPTPEPITGISPISRQPRGFIRAVR